MSAETAIKIVFELEKLELLEKGAICLIGIGLTRVEDEVIQAPSLALPDDRRHLIISGRVPSMIAIIIDP